MPTLSSRDRVNAALVAAALVVLVVTGFLVTLYDDARWGGIIVFAGAVAGILSVGKDRGTSRPVRTARPRGRS